MVMLVPKFFISSLVSIHKRRASLMKKEANMQKRRWKITALISKKAINMADFALISEHLSP